MSQRYAPKADPNGMMQFTVAVDADALNERTLADVIRDLSAEMGYALMNMGAFQVDATADPRSRVVMFTARVEVRDLDPEKVMARLAKQMAAAGVVMR